MLVLQYLFKHLNSTLWHLEEDQEVDVVQVVALFPVADLVVVVDASELIVYHVAVLGYEDVYCFGIGCKTEVSV